MSTSNSAGLRSIVIWVVTPYSFSSYQDFRNVLPPSSAFNPKDGGNTFLRDFGNHRDYKAFQPWKTESTVSQL
jgi:hypothetical protein